VPYAWPQALLVVSAHWEAQVPTVMTAERPALVYDYAGFPPEAYTLTWPAPGSPSLARRVQTLLHAAGFRTATDAARGFDHGVFIPLNVTYPEADLPAVQLSLIDGLDPEAHVSMGRALAPLRDEGIFIVGSGMTYHNLRTFFTSQPAAASEVFDTWLREAVTAAPDERARRLTKWADAPAARVAHPREEHLLPLLVAAGAAGSDRGEVAFSGTMAGQRLSAYHFGA
jgi:aromatic ring-opening dioxygenase catalytic subunit (LigB family)